MLFEVGQTLGRYRIVASLGAGGMGEVYRAHDSRLDRDVAVKLLKQTAEGPDATAAIMAEARAVSSLSHVNVCTLHEVDEVEGHTFLVMELVEGGTLASLIASRTLSIERAVR
jgi:serine/threonine protein kinase